jgi:hypothetical protein
LHYSVDKNITLYIQKLRFKPRALHLFIWKVEFYDQFKLIDNQSHVSTLLGGNSIQNEPLYNCISNSTPPHSYLLSSFKLKHKIPKRWICKQHTFLFVLLWLKFKCLMAVTCNTVHLSSCVNAITSLLTLPSNL